MKKRGMVIAIVAVVAVAAAATVWFLVPRGGSAEDQALSYLRALADGDPDAVRATGIEVSPEAASAFLKASEYLGDVAVKSSTEGESSTTVLVSYVLGDEQHETELTMTEDAGRWTPEELSALGSANFDQAVEIGDARFSADADAALLPAMYDAVASPVDFVEGNTELQVLPGSAQDVSLEAILRPEATTLAQEQLDEYVATCATAGAEVPASCGIVIPWAADFADVSEIRYLIEKTPAISLTPTTFHASGGVLTATVTGTSLDGAPSTVTYRTSSWSLRGDVSFADDDVVLSVW